MSDDNERVGIEIIRKEDHSWRETVARYARLKNLVSDATMMFDDLVSSGFAEPWAALKALDHHGCTDVIISNQHLAAGQVNRYN